MWTPQNPEGVVFGNYMRATAREVTTAVRRKAYDKARRFKQNWEGRFGHINLMLGEGGTFGVSELEPKYEAWKIKRVGFTDMLILGSPRDDPRGKLSESIKISPVQYRRRGFYTEVWYSVYTDNPKFPYHEYGLFLRKDGMSTVRMTLRPTELEVAGTFALELNREYLNIMTRMARSDPGYWPRDWEME